MLVHILWVIWAISVPVQLMLLVFYGAIRPILGESQPELQSPFYDEALAEIEAMDDGFEAFIKAMRPVPVAARPYKPDHVGYKGRIQKSDAEALPPGTRIKCIDSKCDHKGKVCILGSGGRGTWSGRDSVWDGANFGGNYDHEIIYIPGRTPPKRGLFVRPQDMKRRSSNTVR